MIKTKQELLNHFSDINEMYNNPFMYQTLSNMIDELLEQQPCEDAISREDTINKIEEWADGFEDGEYFSGKSVADAIRACGGIVAELPSVTPSHEDLKEAYINGYDYGVKDWFKAKTDKPDIKAEIIKRIEQVRDNDKNAGEYPYNRCIEIIKEVMG